MADSIFTESTPRWRQENTVSGQELGATLAGIIGGGISAATNKDKNVNFLQAWGRGFMEAQDSQYDLKRSMALLQLDSQKTQLDETKMTIADRQTGMKEYAAMLEKTGGDPKKIMDTPW